MEIIRKKISLDPLKSHIDGILPFVGGNGGSNFGKYVYDNAEMRTCDMMRRYNILLEILRKSLHLKRLANVNDCNKESGKPFNKYYEGFQYNNTTNYFLFNEDIGVYNINDFKLDLDGKFYVNVNEDIRFEYVILVSDDDWERFIGYGGMDYVRRTNEIIYKNSRNVKFNKMPYIPVPILLTCEYADVGLMTEYHDWFNDWIFKRGNTREWFDYIESSGLTPTIKDFTDDNIMIETQISRLRIDKYFYDDEGNLLPGIFKEFNGEKGKFYRATYQNSNWQLAEYGGNDLKCGDDEALGPNVRKYRTSTTLETVKGVLENIDANNGESYYFLVRYDNSSSSPMTIPYVANVVVNKDGYGDVFTGDYVKEIRIEGSEITFIYVVGAVFSDSGYTISTARGGTIYAETYDYYLNVEDSAPLDGLESVKYWYNKIDFDTRKVYVDNEEFNLQKYENLTKINQLVVGDVWRQDGSVLNSPIFKEDYLMGISMNPVTEIDVEIDRGNAAAFERHLMLCECNTYQDLEEQKNGSLME